MATSKAISQALSIAIVIVIIVVAFGGYLVGSFQEHTQTTTITIPTTQTVTSTQPPVTTTMYSPLGLELGLTINASAFIEGEGINITVQVINALQTVNNVTTTNDWAYTGNLNPFAGCPVGGPLGLAIFQGNYGSTNFTSGEPLTLYTTEEIYLCTTTTVVGNTSISQKNYYSFQPHSDQSAFISPSYTPDNMNTTVSLSFSTNGYWTGAPFGGGAAFHDFPQGNYTVLAVDEWGQADIAHFKVSSSSTTSSSTSESFSTVCTSNEVTTDTVTQTITLCHKQTT